MTANSILYAAAETSAAVALLIILVLIVRRPVKRVFGAGAAYALWLAPAARLLLPELKILPASSPVADAAPPADFVFAQTLVSANTGLDWFAVASAAAIFLWVTIAVAWIALRMEEHRRFISNAISASSPAPLSVMRETRAVATDMGMNARFRMRIAQGPAGPLVIGVFRPLIILPADFETEYTPAERRLAIAHELAHIARGDLTAGFAAMIIQALQWPNPLIHVAVRAFRVDQEAACDAAVLKRASGPDAVSDYACAILKTAKRTHQPAYGLSLGHPLKERLMSLTQHKPSFLRQTAGRAIAALLVVGGLAATASYGYAASDEDKSIDEDVRVEVDVVKEKRVLIFNGTEDEIIFDDMVVGDRVRVLEFDDGKGERRVIRVHGKGDHDAHFNADCVSSEEDGEPVMLEWRNETGDDENKHVSHTVICLTGEEATPENRAKALREAIDKLEKNAKAEEQRRKDMIKSLRAQARELEKQQ